MEALVYGGHRAPGEREIQRFNQSRCRRELKDRPRYPEEDADSSVNRLVHRGIHHLNFPPPPAK